MHFRPKAQNRTLTSSMKRAVIGERTGDLCLALGERIVIEGSGAGRCGLMAVDNDRCCVGFMW